MRWNNFGATTRKAAVPAVCIFATLALAAGLFGAGVVDARQTAVLVFALYIGSKVFMVGIGVWIAARHSPKFRRLIQRHFGG